jgi:hypothetical protein
LTNAGRDVYEASSDGTSLNTYGGADAGDIDLNGELNKLAWNVTIGHGIHAGIHFRSSSYWSILLGEQGRVGSLERSCEVVQRAVLGLDQEVRRNDGDDYESING